MNPLDSTQGRPLKGVRVIDLTRHLPGPFAAKLLCDLGAEVIKVELPQMPDPGRAHPALFKALNRGKKLQAFDYSKGAGQARLLKLLKTARVLIEGFRPGLMTRLGLDYKALRKRLPGLIYCSITGYGQTGPWSRVAGHDLNYLAMSGALSQTGALPPAPMADMAGAFYASLGITAALRRKKGAFLDISMTEAAQSILHLPASEAAETGKAPKKGERWWNGSDAFYGLYDTQEGRQVAVAALEDKFAARLLQLLGLERLEPMLADRAAHAQDLREALAAAFRGKSRDEWAALLFDKEACVAPVLDVKEALQRK